jgi:hypothetical protein
MSATRPFAMHRFGFVVERESEFFDDMRRKP